MAQIITPQHIYIYIHTHVCVCVCVCVCIRGLCLFLCAAVCAHTLWACLCVHIYVVPCSPTSLVAAGCCVCRFRQGGPFGTMGVAAAPPSALAMVQNQQQPREPTQCHAMMKLTHPQMMRQTSPTGMEKGIAGMTLPIPKCPLMKKQCTWKSRSRFQKETFFKDYGCHATSL